MIVPSLSGASEVLAEIEDVEVRKGAVVLEMLHDGVEPFDGSGQAPMTGTTELTRRTRFGHM